MLLVWAAGPCSGHAQTTTNYIPIDLGIEGRFFSQATAIDASGQVLITSPGDPEYFLWNQGVFRAIATPAHAKTLTVNALSDSGELAVTLDGHGARGRSGAFFRLGPLPTGSNSMAYAISPDGAWVVGMADKKLPVGNAMLLSRRAVRWSGKSPQDLGTLGGREATALAVNRSGQVAGWSTTANESIMHATLWAGSPRDLHGTTVRQNSRALAINDAGMVVGEVRDLLPTTILPFVWTEAGGMKLLPTTGYVRGTALDVNNRGQIVGVLDGSAILWESGRLINLQDRIPRNSGWDLDEANSINDAGWIVGLGKRDGLRRAVLLKPDTIATNPCEELTLDVEFLDPKVPHPAEATHLCDGDEVTSDVERLAAGGSPAAAVAADGAARVVLRLASSEPATITLSLRTSDGASGFAGTPTLDGALASPGSASGSDTLTVETRPLAGRHLAFAVFHAPQDFARPGSSDANEVARFVQLQARVRTARCDEIARTIPFVIVRPPLLVMHGLWSSRKDAFERFESEMRQRLPGIEIFGPNYANAQSFADNFWVVRAHAVNAREALAAKQTVARRVDVFAHSMGGLLSRIWAGSPEHRRPDNHGAGDLHKLVTIDTPHFGSFLANYRDEILAACPQSMALLEYLMAKVGMPIHRGAIDDLRTYSGPILHMNLTRTHVPSHVIAGDAGSADYANQLVAYLSLISELANELPNVEEVKRLFCINELPPIQFPGSSDWIVSVNSQLGGLPAQSVFEHEHWGAANQYAVILRSIELLNAAAASASFARFPVTVPPREGGPLPRLAGGAGPRVQGGVSPKAGATSLRFVTPAPGAMVRSGRSVDVTVDTEPPGSLSALLLVSRGYVGFRTNGPFTFRVAIPTNAAGPQTIAAVGKDVQGALLTNEVAIVAQPAAILDSLTVFPASFQLQLPGVTEQLLVLGNYRDGVVRDLTAAATGTTYTSGDPTIVSVSADGLLEPKSNGHTLITVRNGVSAQIPITVNLLPSANLAVQFDRVPTNVLTSVAADFVMRVTNAGPDAAGSVVLRQSLPDGALVTGVSAEALQWSQREGELNCHLGNVPGNASVAVTVRLVFEVAGEFTTTAETSAAGFDGVPDNNRAEASVAVREPARLHATFVEGWVALSWSTNFSGYILESSISLGADSAWEVVATPPAAVADRLELRVSPVDAARFYRLRQGSPRRRGRPRRRDAVCVQSRRRRKNRAFPSVLKSTSPVPLTGCQVPPRTFAASSTEPFGTVSRRVPGAGRA